MSQRVRRALVGITAAVIALLSFGPSAQAHGFTSTVYADVASGEGGIYERNYGLSTTCSSCPPPTPRATTRSSGRGTGRSRRVTPAPRPRRSTPTPSRLSRMSPSAFRSPRTERPARRPGSATSRWAEEGVPYAGLLLDWACPEGSADPEVRSTLFPDAETYVKGTKTIVTYEMDGRSGSAALDAAHPSFSMGQAWYERFWEFFRLGAEHLLGGIDHILFLLALIAGSRRLREIVLAATSFTLAHSVTFMLAALGLVDVPSKAVEPVIALSIAVVAGWYLWQIRRRGGHAADLDLDAAAGRGHFSLDRAGWLRLGVVFCFGLVHGLGFAGALGIDEAFSWTLLWSLLVFNVGIETVQLAIIALVFPLLTVLRRRAPTTGLWATGVISAGVSVMGLVWFVQRLFGL